MITAGSRRPLSARLWSPVRGQKDVFRFRPPRMAYQQIFLDGVPEIARYDVIRVGATVEEQLRNALDLEVRASKTYNEGCQICLEDKDAASREIMEQIIRESEESIDWLEAQLDMIDKLGIQNYMLSQVGEE